jgi:uncharacterized coiled-coil protein SlyX
LKTTTHKIEEVIAKVEEYSVYDFLINLSSSKHDVAIQHLTVGLSESIQMSDFKNKTAEQDKLIQSLSNELVLAGRLWKKIMLQTQLQQNTEHLNNELQSLSERIASLEHKIPPPQLSTNAASVPFVTPSMTNVTNQTPFPINQTISMIKPDLKILSIAMFPNPLKVGDKPKFTVTFQNISDKELFQNLVRCNTDPSLHWDIYPSSDVQNLPPINNGLACLPITKTIKPNDISMANGMLQLTDYIK